MKKLGLVVVLAALSGCASYTRVTTTEITPRTELRVRFAAPRDMSLTAPNGDTLTLHGVKELRGILISLKADSIRLGLTNAQLQEEGGQRFGVGTTTTFAVADAQMERVTNHPGRTVFFVITLVGGLALLIATVTYQDPPPPPPPEPKPPKQ